MARKSVMEKVVELMRRGRYGRACRTFARWKHQSPRLLKGKDRKKWLEERKF
jgi:hypothetical protein